MWVPGTGGFALDPVALFVIAESALSIRSAKPTSPFLRRAALLTNGLAVSQYFSNPAAISREGPGGGFNLREERDDDTHRAHVPPRHDCGT